jgi:hypothetical protein
LLCRLAGQSDLHSGVCGGGAWLHGHPSRDPLVEGDLPEHDLKLLVNSGEEGTIPMLEIA